MVPNEDVFLVELIYTHIHLSFACRESCSTPAARGLSNLLFICCRSKVSLLFSDVKEAASLGVGPCGHKSYTLLLKFDPFKKCFSVRRWCLCLGTCIGSLSEWIGLLTKTTKTEHRRQAIWAENAARTRLWPYVRKSCELWLGPFLLPSRSL